MKKLIRKDPKGYELWEEDVETGFRAEHISGDCYDLVNAINSQDGAVVTVKRAYNKNGDYVGNEETAEYIYGKGIEPEWMKEDAGICSIGFCEKEQKWYGWSHRAIFGFKIGDVVKKGDCTNSPGVIEEYLKDHPEADLSLPVGFEAKTLEDCKRMAIAFSDSVG